MHIEVHDIILLFQYKIIGNLVCLFDIPSNASIGFRPNYNKILKEKIPFDTYILTFTEVISWLHNA